MSLENNKALVRRYFEDAPYHPGACDEIFAPSLWFHTIQHPGVTPQGVESTPESEKASYQWQRTVWSAGYRATVDEMIAEGDRVMVRWTFRGTHEGDLAGLPPTHKPVTYCGINIFRIADGKIAEAWDLYDRLWMWQQLGVLPDINQAIAKTREAMLPGARSPVIPMLTPSSEKRASWTSTFPGERCWTLPMQIRSRLGGAKSQRAAHVVGEGFDRVKGIKRLER